MLFISLTILLAIQLTNCVEVQLPNGRIKGRSASTIEGFNFYAFQEIPYAAPPIGKLRFKAPIEPENWSEVLETTENTKICFQGHGSKANETEDCLYLNVYTPLNPENLTQELPVLFFIHGGRFSKDSGVYSNYGPDFLIAKDIVIVTINYRLGPFGFLSLRNQVIPGNYGLKDQNFALQWVKKNIHLFGGDPNKVTIMGQSAGGASAAYQIISKKSKGLFRGAIVQSGTAISSWAYQKHPTKIAYQLCAAINKECTKEWSSEDVLKVLVEAPAKAIDKAKIVANPGIRLGRGNAFAPVMEQPSEEAFITDSMHESLKNGNFNQVPLLIGYNSEEKIHIATNLKKFKRTMDDYDNALSEIVSGDFNVKALPARTKIGKKIRKMYTSGSFSDDLAAAVQFHSDLRYTTSVLRHAHLQSNYTDVFLYQFSYDGKMGNDNTTLEGISNAVAHGENTKYLWRVVKKEYDNTNRANFPESDQVTSTRFVEIITNFVKYLNPTPETSELLQNLTWPKVNGKSEDLSYVNIDKDLSERTCPKLYKEWKALYDTHGHPPFITY